jgi:hypothetical protein
MKPVTYYLRSTKFHIRSFFMGMFLQLCGIFGTTKKFGWITGVFITEKEDNVWLFYNMRLINCAVKVLESSSLPHNFDAKIRNIQTVYFFNHRAFNGNAFFNKSFAVFRLPERRTMMESVWDFLYYMIGYLVWEEYYINQCKTRTESTKLCLHDTTEIAHYLAPIIRDACSEIGNPVACQSGIRQGTTPPPASQSPVTAHPADDKVNE